MAETSVFGNADYTKWAEALWAQQHNGAEAKFGVDFGLEEIYAMIESTMDTTLKEQVEEAEKFWSETLADNQDYKKLENRLKSSINNLFDLYASDVEELPNYLEDERQKKIAEIRAGVDMTPDEELWDRVTEAEEAIRDLNAQYEHRYDTMTEGERVISARMEEAYKSGNIEEFNRLADILNQGRSEMAGEQISYMEDLTEKAVAAANSAERDATVQATLDSMRQSREALDEAFANGFKTQLDDIAKASIDEKGNFDMKSYRKALDVIKENNELLYNTLMKSVPQLEDIINGEMTEEEAASMFTSEDARKQLSEAAKTVYEGWQKQVENFESEIMSRNGDHNAVLKFIADQFDILKDPAVIGDLVASVSGSAKDVLDAAFKAAGMEDISPAFEGAGGKSFILSYVSGTVEQLGRYMDTLANGKVTPNKLAEGFNALKKAMLVEDGSGRQNILDFWNGLDTTKQNKFTSNTGLTAEWFEKLAKGEKLSAEELRALNDELLRAEFVSKSGSWKVLSDAVKEMGTNATDTVGKVSGVMDEMDKLGQARAGLKWLLGDGKNADRETVEAVRSMVAGIVGVAEDVLKDETSLSLVDAFFNERNMKQMQDGIQAYYQMFLDMTKDLGVNIDFSNNETIIAGLTQLKNAVGDGIVSDMADSFIMMLSNGLIELGEETATVIEQSLDFEKIKKGVFDSINSTKSEYGKALGLKTLLEDASVSEDALRTLAERWNATDKSVRDTLRTMSGVDPRLWDILDKGVSIDSTDLKTFSGYVSDIDPSTLVATNSELEKLKTNLANIKSGGADKAKGLGAIKDEVNATKQGIAAYLAYISEDTSLEMKAAAKKAVVAWLGIPESMFDTDTGLNQIKEEAERKREEASKVYEEMYNEIADDIVEKRNDINAVLKAETESKGGVWDADMFWQAFDELKDPVEKINMLVNASSGLGDAIPNLYAYAEAIKYLKETGDLNGLTLNFDGITGGDVEWAKYGLGTFDVFDKMSNSIKGAKEMVKTFKESLDSREEMEKLRDEWQITAETVQKSLLEKIKLPEETRKELEELLNADKLDDSQW